MLLFSDVLSVCAASIDKHIYTCMVNDDLDNTICSNASEAYGLLLSGFGYAFLPEHEIMKHPDIITFKWAQSPHAPFGIYSKTSVLKDKSSSEYVFIMNAKELYKI